MRTCGGATNTLTRTNNSSAHLTGIRDGTQEGAVITGTRREADTGPIDDGPTIAGARNIAVAAAVGGCTEGAIGSSPEATVLRSVASTNIGVATAIPMPAARRVVSPWTFGSASIAVGAVGACTRSVEPTGSAFTTRVLCSAWALELACATPVTTYACTIAIGQADAPTRARDRCVADSAESRRTRQVTCSTKITSEADA
jgi:hypothetical protein